MDSGKEIINFSGPPDHVLFCIAFSPNENTLASVGWDENTILWDLVNDKEIKTLTGHGISGNLVTFSPDGKLIASSGSKSLVNEINIWNVSSGKKIKTASGHSSDITSVAFSPDGKALASGSKDNTIKLWDIATGECIYTAVSCPDSQWIVYSQSNLYYNSSPWGSDYASIRFDGKLHSLYPLSRYPELKIPDSASLPDYLKRQSPVIYPKKYVHSCLRFVFQH